MNSANPRKCFQFVSLLLAAIILSATGNMPASAETCMTESLLMVYDPVPPVPAQRLKKKIASRSHQAKVFAADQTKKAVVKQHQHQEGAIVSVHKSSSTDILDMPANTTISQVHAH